MVTLNSAYQFQFIIKSYLPVIPTSFIRGEYADGIYIWMFDRVILNQSLNGDFSSLFTTQQFQNSFVTYVEVVFISNQTLKKTPDLKEFNKIFKYSLTELNRFCLNLNFLTSDFKIEYISLNSLSSKINCKYFNPNKWSDVLQPLKQPDINTNNFL